MGHRAGAYRAGLFVAPITQGAVIATDANDSAALTVEEVADCA